MMMIHFHFTPPKLFPPRLPIPCLALREESANNILTAEWCDNFFKDLPTPFCKEARLTYVRMHERVQRTFSFVVSSPGGVAEAIFKVNFTVRQKTMSNAIDETDEEELSEPEEIHFPVFGSSQNPIIVRPPSTLLLSLILPLFVLVLIRSCRSHEEES